MFNQLVSRWNTEFCGGGLRWQIYQWLPGWNYKNLASNGGMFQLGARLALYTGNDSYAKHAEDAFNWMISTPLITDDWQIYDGMDVLKNCTEADRSQWTYNYGIIIGGAAYVGLQYCSLPTTFTHTISPPLKVMYIRCILTRV